jgi:hypothetical protein
MANMSYCRFENTLHALQDCEAHLKERLTIGTEINARQLLIDLCAQITSDLMVDGEMPQLAETTRWNESRED